MYSCIIHRLKSLQTTPAFEGIWETCLVRHYSYVFQSPKKLEHLYLPATLFSAHPALTVSAVFLVKVKRKKLTVILCISFWSFFCAFKIRLKATMHIFFCKFLFMYNINFFLEFFLNIIFDGYIRYLSEKTYCVYLILVLYLKGQIVSSFFFFFFNAQKIPYAKFL